MELSGWLGGFFLFGSCLDWFVVGLVWFSFWLAWLVFFGGFGFGFLVGFVLFVSLVTYLFSYRTIHQTQVPLSTLCPFRTL